MVPDDRTRGVIRLGGTGSPSGDRMEAPGAPPGAQTGRGALQAHLNWPPDAGVDLDLGCLAEYADGSVTAVQPLGETFGSLTSWPYVVLDQDDRTGEEPDGQTLRVNLAHLREFRRLLFYVTIYEGAPDFRRLRAALTVSAPSSGSRTIALDDSPGGATACAVAMARVEAGELSVEREMRWFTPSPMVSDQEQLDRAYEFGIEWVPATKRPRPGREAPRG
ncbi:tellurium resistance protein [Streptomyces armeniacus]|uniref:Tellurium resistance protein n=1 Tax=Streptomyces armeniacus TaxID=83291 RepID=A0A345XYC3_9ACTN|nr:tellurium resistance protein [Streptomyces armeniacus]AXK36639.1 tellurium resistance protein [Streptomyces armeniacus]